MLPQGSGAYGCLVFHALAQHSAFAYGQKDRIIMFNTHSTEKMIVCAVIACFLVGAMLAAVVMMPRHRSVAGGNNTNVVLVSDANTTTYANSDNAAAPAATPVCNLLDTLNGCH
jgi:hypothetical protein